MATGEEERPNIEVHAGPPPTLGETLLEREIPSDAALVKPLVIRTLDFLQRSGLIGEADQNKVGLCLEEGLMNAVTHGNRNDFRKKVRLGVHAGDREWSILISDEGAGFDPEDIRSPVQENGVWGESGRGLFLIAHYMDRIEYFNGGSTVVMARCPHNGRNGQGAGRVE